MAKQKQLVNRQAIKQAYKHNLTYMADVCEITKVIKPLGFEHFSYSKYNNTIRLIELMNHFSYAKDYLDNINKFNETDFFENYLTGVPKIFRYSPYDVQGVLNLSKSKIYKKSLDH